MLARWRRCSWSSGDGSRSGSSSSLRLASATCASPSMKCSSRQTSGYRHAAHLLDLIVCHIHASQHSGCRRRCRGIRTRQPAGSALASSVTASLLPKSMPLTRVEDLIWLICTCYGETSAGGDHGHTILRSGCWCYDVETAHNPDSMGRVYPVNPSARVLAATNPPRPLSQVLGFTKGPPAGSFAVPFSHSFSGRAVGAELSLAAQRHEYCEGHRRRRAAAAELMSEPLLPPVPAPSEYFVQCGACLPAACRLRCHRSRLLFSLVLSKSCRNVAGAAAGAIFRSTNFCLSWSCSVHYHCGAKRPAGRFC